MNRIVVIGAGVMGSALAIHVANNDHPVRLWGTEWDTKAIDEMKETQRHKGLDVDVPEGIEYYYHNQLEEALVDADLVVIAVLSHGVEAITKELSPYLNERHIILNITKGIDEKSLTTISTLIEDTLPQHLQKVVPIVKIGGPIIATELANGKYTEAVFASKSLDAVLKAQKAFESSTFKVNISQDIIGVDLCAAFKNSYAIAMGMMEGIEENTNNSKAALMARGTIEMSKIVEASGGDRHTASGIAGVGDYYVTSQGGRNGIFGYHVGKGLTKEEALEKMNTRTVEGLAATLNGYHLLQQLEKWGKIDIKKDVPLFYEIYQILYENKNTHEAMNHYWNQ